MPVPGYISDQTTVLSNLSLTGQIMATGATINGSSFGSQSILTVSRLSSSVSIVGNAIWASSFSQGGVNLPVISSTSSLVGAFNVNGSSSSFTLIIWSAVQPGDQIITTVQNSAAVSSLSSGLVLHSHCTVAGQFEFRVSNVSTLLQPQSSRTYLFTLIRPVY